MLYAKEEAQPAIRKLMFYDFETYLDEHNRHVVNFAVLQDFNENELTFNSINDFCVHIFKKQYKDYTFIAHYAKGFDVHFILNWLIGRAIKPNYVH